MSQSSRRKQKQKKPRQSSSSALQGQGLFAGGLFYLQVLVAALLILRLLIPTETSVQGGTLWVVQLWLLAGLGGTLLAARSGFINVKFDRFDWLLLLIVIGHAVATLTVFTSGGDRRSAVNMVWEWVSLGVTFYLIRRIFSSQQHRQHLLLGAIAAGVALAGYGLWQNHVIYPKNISQYEQILKENSGTQLQQKLNEIGVPTDRVGRMNWENRLRSTEPIATFGLANSFAGLLGSLFVALLIWGTSRWKKEPMFMGVMILSVGMMAYCLILTKSRTAWVGVLAGLLLWGVLQGTRKSLNSQKWLLRIGMTGVLAVALFAIAGLSGGIDREVFSEAPKSMLYRLQWWEGTRDVIREHPLVGVGPGNFRSHYLQHKLAESSEAIADPHNLFLDIWTSGGLLALFGLIGMLIAAVFVLYKAHRNNDSTTVTEKESKESDPVLVGTTAGFMLLVLLRWVLGVHFDVSLVMMLICWVVVYRVLKRLPTDVTSPIYFYVCSGTVLLVHTLGAGGIERPAIVQTLLLLLAVVIPIKERSTTETASSKNEMTSDGRMLLPAISFWVVLFLCCLMTATLPVLRSEMAIKLAMVSSDDFTRKQYLAAAATADPLSTTATLQLAQQSFAKWNRPIKEEEYFSEAIKLLSIVLEKEPRHSNAWRMQGEWYLKKYQQSSVDLDINSAVESFSQAVKLYPTSVFFRKDLALALHESNKSTAAGVEATEALRLDSINRQHRHTDKYLSDAEIQSLQQLIKTE